MKRIPEVVHLCMSSEVEVLKGGEAVFGGQERGDQGGDDVRVVREVVERAGQLVKGPA